MTPELITIIDHIEALKKSIADKRDELRQYVDDLNSVIESIESGCDALDDGIYYIRQGCDEISELL